MGLNSAQSKLKQVTLVTDGSCLGNPGPGGWAALLRYQNHEKLISGGEAETTNNRMELTAVIEALKMLKEKCQVHIISDSRYFIDAFDKGWLASWQQNGWKTAQKEQVKNQDLWQTLDNLLKQHDITFEWVKSHEGHPENEQVDKAAKKQASLFLRPY